MTRGVEGFHKFLDWHPEVRKEYKNVEYDYLPEIYSIEPNKIKRDLLLKKYDNETQFSTRLRQGASARNWLKKLD